MAISLATIEELFTLISNNNNDDEIKIINKNNEDKIINKLKQISNLSRFVNSIRPNDYHQESMLMWAVWTLKPRVVAFLIKVGAYVKYRTSEYDSVATYWNHELISSSKLNMKKACEIARMLHNAGVNLNYGSKESSSLTKRAKEYNLLELQTTLKDLGYKL